MISQTPSSDSALGQATAAPAGSGDYVVSAGECVHSIAFEHGHFWETIWNHPDNSAVKSARKNPSLLLEGDRLTIPPIQPKEMSGSSEAKHRFQGKRVPGKLVLILTRPDEDDRKDEGTDPNAEPNGESSDPEVPDPKPQKPWSGAAWKCIIDDKVSNGTTGSDGKIEITISPAAREGRLIVEGDKPTQKVIVLRLGHLDPADSQRGVMQRLRGLGYEPGSGDPPAASDSAGQAQLRSAIETFQAAHGLDRTGRVDQPTMDKLKEIHGS